jgi:uncharacterized protein YnzC (UPF0291/DUF896 family)
MEQAKIARINELTRISRQRELTAEEAEERRNLRAEYVSDWRRGAEATLNSVVVLNPDGTKHKLRRRKRT